jgi:hypothetical protein
MAISSDYKILDAAMLQRAILLMVTIQEIPVP